MTQDQAVKGEKQVDVKTLWRENQWDLAAEGRGGQRASKTRDD